MQSANPLSTSPDLLGETQNALRWHFRRWNTRLRIKRTVEWLPRGIIVGLLISLVISLLSRLPIWFTQEEALPYIFGIVAAVIVGIGIGIGLRALLLRSTWRDIAEYGVIGLVAAILAGIFSYGLLVVRPRLYPEELAQIGALVTSVSALLTVVIVWVLPRSVDRSARNYDERFELRERLSTALEISRGTLQVTPIMLESQLEDTRRQANRVNVKAYLPVRVSRYEVMLVLIALGSFLTGFVFDNPFTDELRQQEELQAVIEEQEEEIEEVAAAIENNPNLTEEEQEELLNPLEEALRELQEDDITQPEAIAAITEAERKLEELASGQSSEERQANAQAGNELGRSPLTNELGDALGESDLQRAAEELRELSQDLESLSQEELNEIADQLDQAADDLENTNPRVAELFREAADALRNGDIEAAQQALNEAAAELERQEANNQSNPQAQAANEAANRLEESRRELSQFGQEGEFQQGEADPSQSSSQQGQQSGQQGQQSGQQGQQSGQQGQQSGQQGQQSGQQGQQSGQQGQQSGQQGQQSGQQGQQSGQAGQQGQQGTSQQGQGNNNQSMPGGSGAGDSGSGGQDGSMQGTPGQGPGEVYNAPGDGGEREHDTIFAPQRIGDDGNDNVERVTDTPDGEVNIPGQETDFNENFSGESQVPYNQVYRRYENAVQEALQSDYIPLGLRDVIREYFSSLEP